VRSRGAFSLSSRVSSPSITHRSILLLRCCEYQTTPLVDYKHPERTTNMAMSTSSVEKDVKNGFTKLKTTQKKSYDGIHTLLTQLLSEIQTASSAGQFLSITNLRDLLCLKSSRFYDHLLSNIISPSSFLLLSC
jgi:hypothetical protein